jgi:GT2 family glycosyltransferase
MSADPCVDIVIPTWNGRRLLERCLQTIALQTFGDVAVTVVDNGSTDGTREFLERSYPDVQVVSFAENRGFSPAVNSGIRAGNCPFVFLLNNDTELSEDCLLRLMDAARQQASFSFFVPKMLSFHDHSILDGAGDGYLRGGAGYRLGTMERDCEFYSKAGPVFGACAGAVLYRRDLFERIGLFDEDFFAYLEDVELNLRINRAGLSGWYVPDARVYHVGSATTGSKINPVTVRLSTRNSFFVLLKHYSPVLAIRLLPVILVYQFCWLLFAVKKGQFSAYCKGVAEVFGFLRVMRKKHHLLRQNDQLTTSEFAGCLKRAEQAVVASIMHRRAGQGRGNALLRLYGTLFLR